MTKSEIQKLKKKINFSGSYIGGIDCSSTVCGWTVMKNQQLTDYGYHHFDNDASMYNRIVEFRQHILPRIEHCEYFVLEDRLKSFNGRTTAETLMKLAHVNSAVEIQLKDMVGEANVFMLHPMSARSCAWGQAYPQGKEKKRYKDTKEWVIAKCMERFNIERGDRGFEIKKRSRKNPKPFKDWTGDVCDAITLAFAIGKG